MLRLITSLCLSIALLGTAHAQAVKQTGNVTPGHPARWSTTGTISDGGTAANGFLTGLGVQASGPGICQNSGPVTGPYQQVCLNVQPAGPAQLILQNFGGASPQSFQFVINGTVFTVPFGGGGGGSVTGPLSSVIGNMACWANTSGTVLNDCGPPGGGGGSVLSVSNSNGTLTISPTTGNVVASLNLAHANTWSALQTFGSLTATGTVTTSALTASGTVTFSGLSAGTQVSCMGLNSSNQIVLVASACGTGGGGAVTSVSNTDSTLTISPTTGLVVASLALNHANTWTATQTFPNASLTAAELASGAAASNVGTLGGALSGTLPSPSIANNAVTNVMLAQMASHTVKCNNTGSTANAADCTSINLNAVTTNFLTSPRTISWFVNDSPSVNEFRWGDKMLVGDAATNYPDTNNCPTGDWFTNFQAATQGACAYIGAFSLVLENKTNNTNNNSGALFAANSLSFGSSLACPSCGTIALMGMALANNNSVGHPAFAIYGECDLTQVGASNQASCLGIEVDVGNFVNDNTAVLPNPFQQTTIVGYQDACGSGMPTGLTFKCGAAMQIVPNDKPFKLGINFLNSSIATQSLFGGSGAVAVAMPATTDNYGIVWYTPGGPCGLAGCPVAGVFVDSAGNVQIVGTSLRFNGVVMTVP